jgi:hypothetical protein
MEMRRHHVQPIWRDGDDSMSVHRISRPPIIAPERAQHSEAEKFHNQLQLAKKSATKEPRLATVSTDGGGRNPGLPSLNLGGNSAMRQSWSFAPVHHDMAAQVETQDQTADVNQDPVVQDGWERAILDEQQRRSEQRDGWERAILDEQQRQAEAAAAEAAEELAALEAAAHAAAWEAAAATREADALQAAAAAAAQEVVTATLEAAGR